MKFLKITLLSLFVSISLSAQNQQYTMKDVVLGFRSNLAIENISQFAFLPNDANFYTSKNDSVYVLNNIKTGDSITLLSLDALNNGLTTENQFKKMPYVKFLSAGNGIIFSGNKYYLLTKNGDNWDVKEWTELPKDAENKEYQKDNKGIAYTINNNLYWFTGGKTDTISNEPNENILYGSSDVHRNEFGIEKGIFIAPDNQKLAFYRMDQTMVDDYPVVDWAVQPAKNTNIKYPMAGTKSHHVTLGVYNANTNSITYMKTGGDPEHYLTSITWSPDSKYVFIGELNRDQNDLKMNMYDASTGDFVKTIFEETSDKYVEPQVPLQFLPNSNTDFIWQSQRDGYNHLYLYNINKGLVGQITKGNWVVTDVLGFIPKSNEIVYTSTQVSPLDRNIYKVNWKTKKTTRIDKNAGYNSGKLSDDGSMLYNSFTNDTTPRIISLIDTKTLKAKTLLVAKNPLKDFENPVVKNVTLKADDGTPLYGKLILPTDFDPNKKYPTIVYLYNGPHVQLVDNRFPASGNLWYDYMAQHGYVVFTMDGRGSYNRGLAFEQATFRQLGQVEMKDQLKGVEYLKSLSYVDSTNMGVHGWSFGGYMTISLMLDYPDVFKAAVAGGPVIDWNMYEIMYTERYMDTPEQNPDGYKETSLLDKTQNLKGNLLVIHDTQDVTVVWQQSIKFIKACVDNGIQVDYFIYPGYPHNVTGKDRVHLMQKITDYFDEKLK